MKYFKDPRFSEKPTDDNLTQYPTILDILEDIAEQEERECFTIDPVQRNIITQMIRRGNFMVVKEKDSVKVDLLPTGKRINILYRGQNKYYENCFPSLYRGWTEKKQLFKDLQVSELKIILNSHPIIHEIGSNPLLHPNIKEPIWLKVNYEGLAQHYGIFTNLLDFSNDKWTAAFFAVTTYDGMKDQYSVKSPGKSLHERFGVFYIYQNDYNQKNRQNAYPIGLHYFNRPGAQSGFALPMENGQNLNTLTHCKKIFFRHDIKANEMVYKMSQHSRSLFPEDELVSHVKTISGESNTSFSCQAIELCFKEYYTGLQWTQYECLLNKYNVLSVNQPISSFACEKTNEEITKWNNGGRERYINTLLIQPFKEIPIK